MFQSSPNFQSWIAEHGPVLIAILGAGWGIMRKMGTIAGEIGKFNTIVREFRPHFHDEDEDKNETLTAKGIHYPRSLDREK